MWDNDAQINDDTLEKLPWRMLHVWWDRTTVFHIQMNVIILHSCIYLLLEAWMLVIFQKSIFEELLDTKVLLVSQNIHVTFLIRLEKNWIYALLDWNFWYLLPQDFFHLFSPLLANEIIKHIQMTIKTSQGLLFIPPQHYF